MSCRIETTRKRDEPLTLLDLVAAVSRVAENERDTIQIVRQLLDTGCVRRAGSRRPVELVASLEQPSGAAA